VLGITELRLFCRIDFESNLTRLATSEEEKSTNLFFFNNISYYKYEGVIVATISFQIYHSFERVREATKFLFGLLGFFIVPGLETYCGSFLLAFSFVHNKR